MRSVKPYLSQGERFIKPRLLHLHIPKTAGRCLKGHLDRNFPPDKIGFWAPHCWQGILEEPLDRLNQLDFISGHFTPVVADLFNHSRPVFKFVVLRQPIERVISHFHYLLQEHPDLRALTLEDFLEDSEINMFADNVQTRIIGSGFGLDEIREIVDNSDELFDPSIGAILKASMEREDKDELFARAVERLPGFDLVGIKEDLYNTTQLLAHKMSMDMTAVIEKRDMHYRHISSIHRSTYRKILDRNDLDSALYLMAKQHFSRAYRLSEDNEYSYSEFI